MKKAFVSSFRSLGKNWSKLLAMSLIIALSFAFIFGISITPSKVQASIETSLKKNKVSDFNVKSLSTDGFTEEEKRALLDGEDARFEFALCLDNASFSVKLSFYELLDQFGTSSLVASGTSKEDAERTLTLIKLLLPNEEGLLCLEPSVMAAGNCRLICYGDGKSEDVNAFNLVEGRMPVSEDEILLDTLYRHSQLGEEVEIFGKAYNVVGVVKNPLYYARTDEPDLINQDSLTDIFYMNHALKEAPSLDALVQSALQAYVDKNSASIETKLKEYFGDASLAFIESIKSRINEALSSIAYSFPEATDAFLYYPERDGFYLYGSYYESFLEGKKDSLQGKSDNWTVLSAKESYSRVLLMQSCRKMNSICYILPLFFLAVSGLVVSISMSRLIEEERGQIACLSSLGYGPWKISKRFYFQAFISTFLGIGMGLLAGYYGVFPLIFDAFNYPFLLPSSISSAMDFSLTLYSAVFVILIIFGLTFAQLKQTLHPLPAELLLPKSPVQGVVTKSERAPFWDKLPFRIKSTVRNLVRYKKRVWMTVLSVGGSTAIVFAGFALLDITNVLAEGEAGAVAKSIVPVSYFLIAFAIMLVALVLYNLTNMSITERTRELATLEVLGYHDGETVFYLYREVAVMTILGLILGIPLGMAIMEVVVIYLEFGSIADIRWYSYLAPVAIMIAFAALVDLLLLPKILRIDMNASLKSVD